MDQFQIECHAKCEMQYFIWDFRLQTGSRSMLFIKSFSLSLSPSISPSLSPSLSPFLSPPFMGDTKHPNGCGTKYSDLFVISSLARHSDEIYFSYFLFSSHPICNFLFFSRLHRLYLASWSCFFSLDMFWNKAHSLFGCN